MRRRAWSLVALLALACAGLPRGGAGPGLPAPADAPGRPALVLLVSVAGLESARWAEDGGMPALAALASAGVGAERVEPVTPAAVYPADASLVTGEPPAVHGIPADHRIGERGVRRAHPSHASLLRAPALWQRVAEAGGAVTALDWPTTTGAKIASLLPDVTPVRAGEDWRALAAAASTDWIAERVRSAPAAAAQPGPARDALLVDLACASLSRAPRLVLLRLRGPELPLVRAGPGSVEAAAAFEAADAEVARLVRCTADAGLLEGAAFVVAGDRAFEPVHTALRPNVWLREAGWITPQGRWQVLVRSNGRSAFVYAGEARSALEARKLLEERAGQLGLFHVVSADEMIARGADPDAWFGLRAEPGIAFENDVNGAAVVASAARGAAGAWPREGGAAAGLVAAGQGIRRGVVAPSLRLVDVGPTLAALLGVELGSGAGRPLVGLLRLAPGTP